MAQQQQNCTVTEFTVQLQELAVECIIGDNEHERIREQTIYLQVSFAPDTMESVFSDDLHDTINYAEVADFCTKKIRDSNHRLLETLVHSCATALLLQFPMQWVRIEARKMQPVPRLEASAVTMTLQRHNVM